MSSDSESDTEARLRAKLKAKMEEKRSPKRRRRRSSSRERYLSLPSSIQFPLAPESEEESVMRESD